jgi:hypothetical protein
LPPLMTVHFGSPEGELTAMWFFALTQEFD